MRTEELDYHLPDDLIATQPATPRDSARLMVCRRDEERVEHCQVRDLPDLLSCNDLLVFNQSKVLPAYFEATRRGTGGKVTGLYLSETGNDDESTQTNDQHWLVMLESKGKLQPGEWVDLDEQFSLELIERVDGGEWRVSPAPARPGVEVLSRLGSPPLPPYIRRARKALGLAEFADEDIERYNTVYASQVGSVAAPTAGLHFTPELLSQLEANAITRAFVTLHVGMGTFMPVRVDDLTQHKMHEEHIEVLPDTLAQLREARANQTRIIPVGTTSVRTLESLPEDWQTRDEPYRAATDLFIMPGSDTQPGFNFRFTDGLMTNFHLPRSTLLALVAALPGVGIARLKDWYAQAITQKYRFYSYGDAMLIL